jgi:hypothetical protein
MSQFLSMQFSLSTGDDEINYFTGEQEVVAVEADPNAILPPGTYRVVDGQLYRIASSNPPVLPGRDTPSR